LFSIVCFQLGFGIALRTYIHGGNTSLPIWLDNVHCTDEDRYLSQCSHNGWGNTNCRHSQDVGISCVGPGTSLSNIKVYTCDLIVSYSFLPGNNFCTISCRLLLYKLLLCRRTAMTMIAMLWMFKIKQTTNYHYWQISA